MSIADALDADYSGEFSHWNFSMRIKQWIEQNVPDQGENVLSEGHLTQIDLII